MSFNLAIDGPAGAGKSTIAKAAAAKLGAVYVDTGAMYRTIALYLLEHETDVENEQALSEALSRIDVKMAYEEGLQQMYLNGRNVSDLIRTEEVSRMASVSAAKPAVREKLLAMQRDIAASMDVIMDGRDIGTRILPNAQLKIFLTASTEARALRRFKEYEAKGEQVSLQEIEEDIRERDRRDREREVSPLKQAEDAYLLDSSDMTIEEVTDTICRMAHDKGM